MNLLANCNKDEKELIAATNVPIENKEYTKEELEVFGIRFQENIMNHSTKEIPELQRKFSRIFDMIYR